MTSHDLVTNLHFLENIHKNSLSSQSNMENNSETNSYSLLLALWRNAPNSFCVSSNTKIEHLSTNNFGQKLDFCPHCPIIVHFIFPDSLDSRGSPSIPA